MNTNQPMQPKNARSPEKNLYRYLEKHDMETILTLCYEIVRQRHPDHFKTRISFVLANISAAASDLKAYRGDIAGKPFFAEEESRYAQTNLLEDVA